MKHLKLLLAFLMLSTFLNASEEVPTQEEVAKLYVATFNRAPDAAGLAYWTNNSGLKLSGIASSFFDQPETKALYPTGTSNADFITSVYANLFNREPDTAGLNYWENELNIGAFNKNRFIEAVINGAQNNATSNDSDILSNKTRVGLSFSQAGLIDKDNSKAKTIMIGVSDDAATMTSAVNSFGISLYIAGVSNSDIILGSQNLELQDDFLIKNISSKPIVITNIKRITTSEYGTFTEDGTSNRFLFNFTNAPTVGTIDCYIEFTNNNLFPFVLEPNVNYTSMHSFTGSGFLTYTTCPTEVLTPADSKPGEVIRSNETYIFYLDNGQTITKTRVSELRYAEANL